MIREVVDDRRMPPWHADPRYGHFANDRSLTARERATLLAWVDQGAPLATPRTSPPAKTFPEGWTIGKPDVVFEIPEPYTVPAQGVVEYVRFRVPTGFKEDRWVQAAEAQPGDRSVVHHIIVYVDDHKRDARDRAATRHLCGYAPGDMPSVYPPRDGQEDPRRLRPHLRDPLHADRQGPDRPLAGGPDLRQGAGDPRGLHHADRRGRFPDPAAPGQRGRSPRR